jgi:hypothetical protein
MPLRRVLEQVMPSAARINARSSGRLALTAWAGRAAQFVAERIGDAA